MNQNQLETRSLALAEQAAQVVIASNEQMVGAAELLKGVRAMEKEVADTFDPIISKAHAAHKEALAQKAKFAAPLQKASASLSRAIGAYQAEQERIRREEQARLEREQREREAAERERLRREEEDRRLAEAQAAQDAGDAEMAEEILSAPVEVEVAPSAPVFVPKATPKVEGVATRETWKADVTDLMALVKAIAAGTVPLSAVKADTVFLGQQARSLKSLMRYPGVRAYPETTTAVRL